MRGSMVVAEVLRREGIEEVFAFPGNTMIDAAAEVGIRPIVGRQERCIVNMADAYSRVTNGKKLGVVMVQQGPGVEHAFGGIAQAFSDSVPVLLLPNGNSREELGLRTCFDAVESFRPVTKWAARFETVDSITTKLRRAFHLLRSGRPGPVVLELPYDVANEELDDAAFDYEPVLAPQRSAADPGAVEHAISVLLDAERPIVRAGQGVLWAEATEELIEFAEALGAPVATSYIGKSAFPETHPLSIGTGGYALSPAVAALVPKCDVVLSIGASLLNSLASFPLPPGRTIIQATNDPDDLSMQYPIACGLVGDAKLVLRQLTDELRRRRSSAGNAAPAKDFTTEIADARAEAAKEWQPYFAADDVPISPLRLVSEMMGVLDPDTTIVTHDSGFPRDHLAPHYLATQPRGYLGWGNSTPLGSSLGLALGAAVAEPSKLSVCYLGDTAFGQCGFELETAVRNKIPILVVLTNNNEMTAYGDYYPITEQKFGMKFMGGQFADIATALGATAYRVTSPEEVSSTLETAISEARSGAAVLVEVITSSLGHRIGTKVLSGDHVG